MHTTRIGIINMLEHSSIGTASIFVPILVNVLTGSYIMAGVTVGSYALVQVLSYIYFGRLSDKRREMIRFVRIGFLASAVVFYMHALAYDGLTFFAIRLAAGMTTGIYAGALLALAYEKGRNNGIILLASLGSIGWLVGTLSSGLIQWLSGSYDLAFIYAGSAFLAGFIVSLYIGEGNGNDNGNDKEEKKDRNGYKYNNNDKDDKDDKDDYNNPNVKSLYSIIKENWYVYSTFMLRHLGASMTWSIFPIFLHEQLGLNSLEIGSIYAINAVTQFLFMSRVTTRMDNANVSQHHLIILLGTASSALVFLIYYNSYNYLHLIPAQIVLGISWSLLYVGSLLRLMNGNREKATAGSLLEAIISSAIVLGSILGGVVAESYGLRSVMLASFSLNIIAFAIIAIGSRSISTLILSTNRMLSTVMTNSRALASRMKRL